MTAVALIEQIGPILVVLAQVLGVLVVGMVGSACVDQVVLACLPRLDQMVLERDTGAFTERVALPFLSAVLGAVLGAFTSLYITGNPSLWQRVGACTALGVTLGTFISVWRRADRALPQQLFDLRQQPADTYLWNRARESIRAERERIGTDRRLSRVVGLVFSGAWLLLQTLPAALACLLYSQRYLPESALHNVTLAVVVAVVGQASIAAVAFLGWPRIRSQRAARLHKFETALTLLESERLAEAARRARAAEAAEERLADRLRQALKPIRLTHEQLGPLRRMVKALLRL